MGAPSYVNEEILRLLSTPTFLNRLRDANIEFLIAGGICAVSYTHLAFDELDGNGVLVHRYGPHIFHTNAPVVSDYLSRFTEWIPYEHRVLASLNGVLYPIPINQTTINRLYGLSLDEAGVAEFLERAREPKNPIRTVSYTHLDVYKRQERCNV